MTDKDKLIDKQRKLIEMLTPGCGFYVDVSDKYFELINEIKSLESELAEQKPEEIQHGIPFKCPECGEMIQYGLSEEGRKLFANSRLFNYQNNIQQNPQKTAEEILDSQIDKIEIEDYLNMIFNDLQKNAYDYDFHGYHFKEANQLIRKYFEAYAQQFQKPLPTSEDYCICGNPSKKGNIHFEGDEKLIYECVDCGKRMKDC